MRTALAILLAGALLAACGQRGALYLPGEQREEVAPTRPPVPAAPVASPIPQATPSAAPTTGAATDETEATRRNRNN